LAQPLSSDYPGVVRVAALLFMSLLVATVTAGGTARATPARAAAGSWIAAAGDSLSTGYASVDAPGERAHDHPENSWAIGSNPAVRSHYARIVRSKPSLRGHALLVAHDGARVDELARQLQRVVDHGGVAYVTIQIGVNDICEARTRDEITPTSVFRTRFANALSVLRRGSPQTRVLATSIADEARWNDAVLRTTPRLARHIEDGTVCDPKPDADGRQDLGVRRLIQRHEEAYNRAIASVCAAVATCRYDGGALYRLSYEPDDVSRHDGVHPSLRGLAKMAAVTWSGSFALGALGR
jgi:lysophospholipase L1-like esterase